MSSLDKMFEEQLQKLPRILFRKLIQRKLEEIGTPENEKLLDEIIEYIESGSEDDFFWHDDGDDKDGQKQTLVITDEDLVKLEEDFSDFVENKLKDVINNTSDDVARIILQSLRDKWPDIDEYEKSINSDFAYNLEKRWGDAFSSLRMMLSICREMGEEALEKFHKSSAKKAQH